MDGLHDITPLTPNPYVSFAVTSMWLWAFMPNNYVAEFADTQLVAQLMNYSRMALYR
jgi:hypothetical protein